MGEKTKKFNLEIGLFLKELNTFIDNDNEINDETVKLLAETILSINKLNCNANYCQSIDENENEFFFELDDGRFQFRRHIVCCLCHDHIPMNREDFEAHIQKRTHQIKNISRSEADSNTQKDIENVISLLDNGAMAIESTKSNENLRSSQISLVTKILSETNLKSLVQETNIFKRIASEAKCLETRNDDRIYKEARILEILSHFLQMFDPEINIFPFGSSTYGFGGSSTNLNILIDTRNSDQNDALIFHSLEKFIQTSDMSKHFTNITKLHADRVMKKQLKMIHEESGIECILVVDSIDITNSSKIIQDFIIIKPICRHLITYVKAWQNIINQNAIKQFGRNAFHFNTYTISALVIFFLQLEYNVKVIGQLNTILMDTKSLENAKNSLDDDLSRFRKMLHEFFYLFGARYQMWNHVMSCYVGRWQERRVQSQQRNFSESQKRLRDGIKQNEANWKNCSMFLQDLVRPDLNITAEISKDDAEYFQELCRVFAIELQKCDS